MKFLCSNSTSTKMSRVSTDEDSLDSSPNGDTSISTIYRDAAAYKELLVREGCIFRKKRGSNVERHESVDGFDQLVGRDLSPCEQAIAARLAKISVTGDHWTGEELTAEPGSYVDDVPTPDASDSQSLGS